MAGLNSFYGHNPPLLEFGKLRKMIKKMILSNFWKYVFQTEHKTVVIKDIQNFGGKKTGRKHIFNIKTEPC